MTEKNWRYVTGWVAVVVGMLALVLLIGRLNWLVKPVLATLPPFVIAFLLALFLNPMIARLERRGMRRAFSVALTSLVFLVIFAGMILLVAPKLVVQGTELAKNMPEYAQTIEERASDLLVEKASLLRRFNLPTTLPEFAKRFSLEIRGFSSSALDAVSGFVLKLASRITWLVIIPLVTIWMLINWDRQSKTFHSLLPKAHTERITRVLHLMGRVLNSYVRGALILAVLYGVMTSLVLGVIFDMPYALILGLVAALMSPIPYIGSIIIMLSTGLVAYATNPSPGYVGGVLIAMAIQNSIIFDNIISPRVLGGSVGLSLPWSMFALMLGGSLFGIAGMILAVPIGAAIKVLLVELVPKLEVAAPESPKNEERPVE